MAGKLAALVALFSLILSAAAFASPADVELGSEIESAAGEGVAGEIEIMVREHQDEEEEFELYLGPRDEAVAGREDRRVD